MCLCLMACFCAVSAWARLVLSNLFIFEGRVIKGFFKEV